MTVLITYDICIGRMPNKIFINIKVGNVKVVKTLLRSFSGSSATTNVQYIFSIYWDAVLDFDPRHSADRNAESEIIQQQLMQQKSLFSRMVFVFVFEDS